MVYIQDMAFDSGDTLINNALFQNITISDGEADTTFETGDVVLGNTYAGTVVIDGITMPVFLRPDGGHQVYNPGPGFVSAPATLPTISTGAFVACFAAGTGIATPRGEVAVEQLRIGTTLRTASGATAVVKWIGRQTIDPRFGPADRLHPVRIAAGALGDGLPHSALTVTADHALLVDGVLCQAGALINGTTITRAPMAEPFTVYHVETEAHDILLANGAHAESFIDNAGRRAFDNFAEFDALYGDVAEMEELPYPRAVSRRQIPARLRDQAPPKSPV